MIALTLALLTFAPVDAPETPTAQELERKMLDYRNAIKTGHVIVRSRQRIDRASPDNERITFEYDIVFEGTKVRSIVTWKSPDWERVTGAVVSGDDYIRNWSANQRVDIGKLPVPNPFLADAIHPRALGIAHTPIRSSREIDLDKPFWFATGESTVTADPIDGEPAWRIDHRLSAVGRVLLWIVPSRGHSLARLEVRFENSERQRSLQLLEVDLRQYGPTGIWYPRQMTYRRSGGQGDGPDDVWLEEVAEVESAEFGIPVKPSNFGVEGLNLPPGRKILGPGHRAMYWDGKRLRQEVARDFPDDLGAATGPSARWPWWVGAGVTILGTIALALRFLPLKG